MTNFTESIIERATIDWRNELGHAFSPDIVVDKSIYTLARSWDSLLPKLMRDDVRVKQVEREL